MSKKRPNSYLTYMDGEQNHPSRHLDPGPSTLPPVSSYFKNLPDNVGAILNAMVPAPGSWFERVARRHEPKKQKQIGDNK